MRHGCRDIFLGCRQHVHSLLPLEVIAFTTIQQRSKGFVAPIASFFPFSFILGAKERLRPRFTLPRFSSWPTVADGEPKVIGAQRSDEEERRGDELEEAAHTTKLYFGNLPYSCDSAQLAAIVQDYGSPELVEVLYDRSTGKSRGFAFVTMSSVQDANTVIQNLDGSEYGGRTLRVNFSDKPKPREPLYPETEFKLFVGNLSWRVTSESLTEIFSQCGSVVGARVLYDGETGRSRGYGFVCYSSKSEMDAALDSLDGVELDGRQLRISLALGKKS